MRKKKIIGQKYLKTSWQELAKILETPFKCLGNSNNKVSEDQTVNTEAHIQTAKNERESQSPRRLWTQ